MKKSLVAHLVSLIFWQLVALAKKRQIDGQNLKIDRFDFFGWLRR